MENQHRQLVAILFTDIVGYTAMMQQNEALAVIAVKRYISVLQKALSEHAGTMLNDYGDGSLCSFSSATQAVRCAIEIQQLLGSEPAVPLRIGLHVGEIFFENDKVLGDAVNVASRIQSLAIANSVLFSSEICNKIKNQQEFKSVSLGKFHFKNVDEAVEVFALANDGFTVPDKKKMEGKLREKKNTPERNLIVILSFILVVIASIFFYRNLTGREAGEKIKSIAVLPFVNGSNDKENDYLSDGIAQEIISRISKIGSIEVKGWLSSMYLKNSNKSLKEKGEALGAEGIVSGNIQKEGNRVLIHVEFVEASTGKRIWGDEYNRQWGDVLNIQTEVAKKIADALNTKLTPQEKMDLSKHYTENVEAYRLYRQGRYFLTIQSGNEAPTDSAKLYFNNALFLDPDYALAYTGLAECYFFRDAGLKQLQWLPISKTYALKALSLDSTLSEALTTIGWIEASFDYDWVKSKITLEKAIVSDPNNAQAHLFYGNQLQYTGENVERGISEIKKAIELDPLNGRYNWVLGRNYYFAHKYDSAYAQLKKEIDLNPIDGAARAYLVLVLLAKKQFAEAFKIIDKMPQGVAMKNFFYKEQFTSYAYAAAGDTTRAKSELDKLLKDDPGMSPYRLAGIYIQLRDYNKALTELERAYEIRDIGMYYFLIDPALDSLRNEPRFKEILKKMHLK